jgi:hypothetical protein
LIAPDLLFLSLDSVGADIGPPANSCQEHHHSIDYSKMRINPELSNIPSG